MKKLLLKVLLILVVCVIIYLIWLPGMKALPFRVSEKKIYTASYNGYEYILKFTSAIDMSIYQYRVGTDDEVYGKRTDYNFTGKYYNHLFWNVYVYPESSLFFWNNVKVFDHGIYDYARISMDADRNLSLNCVAEPTRGRYTEEVKQIGDGHIQLGPILFTDAEEEEDVLFAEKVILLFESKGRVIE